MVRVDFDALDGRVKGYMHEDHAELIAHKVRPALIVCPGGAYRFISPREGDPPALAFFAAGYNVFILDYSVMKNASAYRPLRELAEAVHIIRANSKDWHIDPCKIAVAGFSAGGHLAASLGVLWNHKELGLPKDCRPDALILAYPVISMYEKAHQESRLHATGGDEETREMLSLEKHIGRHVPPVFLWHTVKDQSVPVENSMMFAAELQKQQVSFECHLFAHGPHGQATCTQEVEARDPACAKWVELCKIWLDNLFCFVP